MLQLIFLIIFPFAVYKGVEERSNGQTQHRVADHARQDHRSRDNQGDVSEATARDLSYSVNGAPLVSQRISFAGGYRPKDTDAILARYPVGKEVSVSYSPDNPAEATLETGATKQVRLQLNFLLICFAIIIVIKSITYYVKSLDQDRRRPIRTYGAAGCGQRRGLIFLLWHLGVFRVARLFANRGEQFSDADLAADVLDEGRERATAVGVDHVGSARCVRPGIRFEQPTAVA